MSGETRNEPSHRRDFVRGVALGGAGAALAATISVAQEVKKAEEAPPRSEADARMDIVLARFGKHKQLDDKAKATIRAEMGGLVRRAEQLRKIPVDNGEGPFPVFRPYRDPATD